MIGPGGRAFTFPRSGGKITLNMGPRQFGDPRVVHDGRRYGETFIHELVHACQIYQERFSVRPTKCHAVSGGCHRCSGAYSVKRYRCD
jgi:hypothetical protein